MTATPQTPFSTEIKIEGDDLVGPWREPKQMLAAQDGGVSIHDDATAAKLGFNAGTIEGPTHFSQFAPLCVEAWGAEWLARGCISAHYRNAVFEGEAVRARMTRPAPGARIARIAMEKQDGVEVLQGTVSLGPDHPASALDQRVAELPGLEQPVILAEVKVGARGARMPVRMAPTQHMGRSYPFSLSEKLERITEPSPWYADPASGPYDQAIIPIEMISVLAHYEAGEPFFSKGPVIDLFADLEIRLLAGPLFVDEPYEIEREVVALSGSRRTESLWIKTRVYRPGSDTVLATTLLNSAILKDSYAGFEAERSRLYGAA